MRIDPKLIKRLEARADANEILAEALGVCPTCGQALPNGKAPTTRGPRTGEKREQIVEWRRQHPKGTQSACSRELGVSQAYVGRIWHDGEANTPHDEAEK